MLVAGGGGGGGGYGTSRCCGTVFNTCRACWQGCKHHADQCRSGANLRATHSLVCFVLCVILSGNGGSVFPALAGGAGGGGVTRNRNKNAAIARPNHWLKDNNAFQRNGPSSSENVCYSWKQQTKEKKNGQKNEKRPGHELVNRVVILTK